jgi:hypothetical protein
LNEFVQKHPGALLKKGESADQFLTRITTSLQSESNQLKVSGSRAKAASAKELDHIAKEILFRSLDKLQARPDGTVQGQVKAERQKVENWFADSDYESIAKYFEAEFPHPKEAA